MSRLRAHFESRAAQLSDCASMEVDERLDGGLFLRLRPKNAQAVGVVLWLGVREHGIGTVALDDQASVPAELHGDYEQGAQTIDDFIDIAVEGRATAFHKGGGGCMEARDRQGNVTRSWMHTMGGLPGWRRRWDRIDYEPYR